MEYNNECYQGATGDEETKRVSDTKEPVSGFLKLSSTTKLMSTINNNEQCSSEDDYKTILTPKSDTSDDQSKNEDFRQGLATKIYQYHEKHRVSPDKFDVDKSPNHSPTNVHQVNIYSDTKNLFDSVMLSANKGWSPPPPDSDGDSGLDEPEEIELDIPLNMVTCSPLSTDKNTFYDNNSNEISFKENIVTDVSQTSDIGSIRLLNNGSSCPDQKPNENLTNKSVIRRSANTWDLTSLSSENKREEGSRTTTASYLPDDEFMEADRYLGDKGKQPASKRYAYKKKSKSLVNQPVLDSEKSSNNHRVSVIKTNHQPSTSSAVSNKLPVEALSLSEDRSIPCTILNETPTSPIKPTSVQEGLKDAGIQWTFHDYAFKLFSSDSRVLNLSTAYRYNNDNHQYSYRYENHVDTLNSDDDVNLQKGLLMSLQSMNQDDDSDIDVTT